MPHIQNNL